MTWWLGRRSREEDLQRELRAHLDLEAEEQRQTGLPPEEARFAALRHFGNRSIIQEETRAMWTWTSFEKFGRDLQHAVRMARKNPYFAALAVMTLAVGIGANTAIFSVVDRVLLRPLPYRDPARLVVIQTLNQPLQVHSGPASYPDFVDWRASGIFEDAGVYGIGNTILRAGDSSERVISGVATASLFSTLGVQLLIGRLPLPAEDKPSANPVTLLSESLWRRKFGSDPSIVGRAISLDGKSSVVVGVLPASFVFDRNPELWTTFERSGDQEEREDRYLSVLARLKANQTLDEAGSRLTALCSHLQAEFPKANQGWSAEPVRWQQTEVAPVRPALLVLLGAVSLVLFICCGNVAMLLLVRGSGRTREFGLRLALGASRARIAAQLLTENLVLAVLGGGFGALLAYGCISLLVKYGPADIPRLSEIHLDSRVLLFASALSFLTPLLFGLGPALQLSRPDVNAALLESGKGSTAGKRRAMLRTGFLMIEMALSLVLLAGAGLLVKSFLRLTSVEPGFRPDHLLTFHLGLPTSKFLTGGEYQRGNVDRYYKDVIDSLERMPRVVSAGGTLGLPLGGGGYRLWQGFALPKNPATAISKTICVSQTVTTHFFQAMGMELRAGRTFTNADTATAPQVALVNETFARKYFPTQNPIGQTIQMEGAPALREIIGVVGDVKPDGLDSGADPEVYKPFTQESKPFLVIVVRTRPDPMSLAADVRSVLTRIDRDVPPYRMRSGEQLLSSSLAQRRFSMALVAFFALNAVLLAAIGLYGVVSYTVTQSTREIGIRVALGAGSRDVMLMALRQGVAPALWGLGAGLVLSIGLTRLLTRMLYEVRPLDPEVLLLVSVALAMVSALACLLPARRATRVDPATALRYE